MDFPERWELCRAEPLALGTHSQVIVHEGKLFAFVPVASLESKHWLRSRRALGFIEIEQNSQATERGRESD